MKTSHKLLLGFLTVVLLAITIFVAVAKYYQQADMVTGNGKTVAAARQSGDFNSIDVNGKISVNLTQGNERKVTVKGDENLVALVHTEISGSQLRIYIKSKINRDSKIEVDVTAPTVESLHLSGGSTVKSTNELKGEELALHTSSGSQANLSLQYKDLDIEASAGAVLHLSGQVEEASIEASSGTIINAFSLNTRKCLAKGNAGAVMEVKATEEISADMSSGSTLTYDGEPTIRNIHSSSGGMIRKK